VRSVEGVENKLWLVGCDFPVREEDNLGIFISKIVRRTSL
jgi:hypothetical protein